MHVAVTGSHGLIGSALVPALEHAGHTVHRIGRVGAEGELLDLSLLGEADAVVHLAGAGIGDAKWTKERKELVLQSRVRPTTQLAEALAELSDQTRPRVLVSGSAVVYYGDRHDDELTEFSQPGTGFL